MYSPQQNFSLIEKYRKELYRIAWKIQYKARVQSNREISSDKFLVPVKSFSSFSDTKIFTIQLINSLPSDFGKKIIYEIFINDKTETQVAQQNCISQQAVSRWKRKMLKELSQMLNSQNY